MDVHYLTVSYLWTFRILLEIIFNTYKKIHKKGSKFNFAWIGEGICSALLVIEFFHVCINCLFLYISTFIRLLIFSLILWVPPILGITFWHIAKIHLVIPCFCFLMSILILFPTILIFPIKILGFYCTYNIFSTQIMLSIFSLSCIINDLNS